MSRIEIRGYDFERILKACAKAINRLGMWEKLRYIELRANGTECVATSLDGFILQQIKVPCDGSGVILLPPTIKPPKCETAIIEDQDNIRITYLDCGGNLIYAHELPKREGEYFDWSNVVEANRAETIIHCSALNLRNALTATAYSEDTVMSISIPENKEKPITIASNDVQMIVLPMRCTDEAYMRSFKNWHQDIELVKK